MYSGSCNDNIQLLRLPGNIYTKLNSYPASPGIVVYVHRRYDFPHNVHIFTPSIEQKSGVARVRNSSNP